MLILLDVRNCGTNPSLAAFRIPLLLRSYGFELSPTPGIMDVRLWAVDTDHGTACSYTQLPHGWCCWGCMIRDAVEENGARCLIGDNWQSNLEILLDDLLKQPVPEPVKGVTPEQDKAEVELALALIGLLYNPGEGRQYAVDAIRKYTQACQDNLAPKPAAVPKAPTAPTPKPAPAPTPAKKSGTRVIQGMRVVIGLDGKPTYETADFVAFAIDKHIRLITPAVEEFRKELGH